MSLEPQKTNIHWPSAVQFGLTLLALSGLLSSGFLLGVTGILQYFSSQEGPAPGISMILIAAGLILSGILLIPPAGLALARLLNRRELAERPLRPVPYVGLLILLFPLVLWLGSLVAGVQELAWFVLPVLHLLAIGLPVAWLLYLARRGLPSGSPQWAWGAFSAGLVLSPALILAAEIAALVALVILAVGIASLQPSLVRDLEALAREMQTSPGDPDSFLRLLAPYAGRPLVIYAVLAFGAGIVPLIEEALKPLGVWLLAGRLRSPAAGFAAGALCGAGYALFESLALSAGGGQDWTELVFTRSGTGIIHIVTTALTGYALAYTWQHGSYLRLAVAYLTAVTLHGLWNGLAILNAFSTLPDQGVSGVEIPALAARIGSIGMLGIAVLALAGFLLILSANRMLRKEPVVVESGL